MSEQQNIDPKSLSVMISNSPTSNTDMVNLHKRSDGSIMLRMVSVTPDHLIENHRTVLINQVAKSLIEKLCEFTGFYPEGPKVN